MKPSWRAALPVHPAAELFPMMSPAELRELGADIKKHGLTSPIALWRADPKGQAVLLDGRNRLDAIEMMAGPVTVGAPSIMAGEAFLATDKVIELGKSVDPWIYVVSANIRRRHLSIEDKDRLIVELLTADPTKSNRAVAKLTDTSHPHVAKVREKAEKAGDVETVSTSIDSKGRKQPAKKDATRKKAPPQVSEEMLQKREESAERIRALLGKPTRDDIGSTSAGDLARKDAEIAELSNANRRLNIKIIGLESEIEEIKERHKPKPARPGEKRSCSFCCKSQDEVSVLVVDRDGWAGICNECVHLATEIIGKQRTVATAVPPAGDGLDLPPSLRRAAP
jgi:DNA-binding Lrp family transcriptional regulator